MDRGFSVIMIMIAICLDLFGFICFLFTLTIGTDVGETLSYVPDLLGLLFIGGARMFQQRRRAFAQAKKVRAQALMKAKKSGAGKFFLTFFGEILPFVGAFPFWTIYILSEARRTNLSQVSA